VGALSEERLELKDQVFNKLDELMQRWEHRITPRNLRFIDRFLDVQVHILLHLLVKNSSKIWVARLDKNLMESPGIIDPICPSQKVVIDGEEHPVLIDVVKLMQSPERFVPTSVRFEAIDSFYRQRAHALYFSSLVPIVSGNILKNRKPGLLSRSSAISKNELVCEMVESGAEVVSNIACCPNRISGQYPKIRLLDTCAGCRINISQEHVLFKVPEFGKLGIEVTEVLLGPLNLYSDPI